MLDKNIAIGREGLGGKYSLLFIHSKIFIQSLLCAKRLQQFLVFGRISVKKIDKVPAVIKLIL